MLEPTCPKCKKSFIQRVKCPTCGYMITPNDFLKYIDPPKHRPFINQGIAVALLSFFLAFCITLVLFLGTGSASTFSYIILILAVIIFVFAAVIAFVLGLDKLRKARTLYDKHHDNLEEYKLQLANVEYAEHIAEAAKPTSKDLEAMRLQQEYEEAIASQQAGEPWRIRYATYPCPHCGHYKVRNANWEDKKLSVAFWGVMSGAIAKSYKCEYCRRMW